MTLVDPQAARAAIGALMLRYNPAQRRDGDGKWTDGPGGGADLTRSNIDMSPDERQFLSDYVEDGATYRRINDALRGQTPVLPEMADKVRRLDNLVGRASLDGDATLYRAMSVKSTDPIMGQVFNGDGGSWTDPGFGSASGDRSAVDDFRGVGDQAIVFEISAKKGQPVLVLGDDLSDRAMMQTPQEVLLPRGYRLEFDTVSSRRRDGIMVHTVKATLADPDPLVEAFAFNPDQRRDSDGPKLPPGSSETSNGPGGTEAPSEFAVVTETTGDPTLGLRARAATAAMELLFGFNPHQLRGPDGKFIKMPASQLRNRRNERARARRAAKKAEKAAAAAKPESDAPDQADVAHRRNRDDFNQKIAIEAVNVQNDNEFDGKPDARLDDRLARLQEAIGRNDPLVADDWADDLHKLLADDYPEVDLPIKPRPPAPEGQSVEIDEAAIRQQYDDALDDYHAEIHATGKAWVDMLRDPEVRADPDSGLDHINDRFVNELGSSVLALRKAILNGERLLAKLHADFIRNILVSEQLQADHDFPRKPVLEEMLSDARNVARAVPQPPSRTSGLLTSGAPITARRAALEAAVAAGVWGDEPIGQGAMGETKKVVFNDGTRAVYKKAKGDWGASGAGDPWTPKHQTDAEELASLVGSALGLRAPAVQRISDDEINMEMVENAGPAMNRFFDRDGVDFVRVPGDVLGSDEGLLMGLFDTLIDNPDRHGFNWMIDDAGRLYPIDHGLAFMNVRGTPALYSAAGRSPFASEYFVGPTGNLKENMLSRRDIAYVRQRLQPLEAEFERIGRPGWYRVMQMRLDAIEQRARGGAAHQLPPPE